MVLAQAAHAAKIAAQGVAKQAELREIDKVPHCLDGRGRGCCPARPLHPVHLPALSTPSTCPPSLRLSRRTCMCTRIREQHTYVLFSQSHHQLALGLSASACITSSLARGIVA